MYQVTTVIIILTEDGYLYDNYDVVDDEWGFARETGAGGRGGVVRKTIKKISYSRRMFLRLPQDLS